MRMLMVAMAIALAFPAFAQTEAEGIPSTEDCDYDSCALRVRRGWSTKLVAGMQHREIKGLGMFPSKDLVDFFGERSEPAAVLYSEYRSKTILGNSLLWGGLALVLGGAILSSGEEEYGPGWAIAMAGFGFSIGGGFVLVGSEDHLSRAVWEYNRTFVGGPAPDRP